MRTLNYQRCRSWKLLLYEKALSAAFANEESSKLEGDEKNEEALRLRAELATKTFVKLIRILSLQSGFGELFPGLDTEEERDKRGRLSLMSEFRCSLRPAQGLLPSFARPSEPAVF